MKDRPEIAIFFGRPERSHILAEQLRRRGFRVVLYNDRGIPETYVPERLKFLPALFRLLSTCHEVYVTGLGDAYARFFSRLCGGSAARTGKASASANEIPEAGWR